MPEFSVEGFLADDPLVLHDVVSEKHPKGKTYTAPDLPYRDVLQLKTIMALPAAKSAAAMVEFCKDDKGNEVDLAEKLLGSAYRQMVADGVPRPVMQRVETLAIVYYSTNEELTRSRLDVIGGAMGEAAARTNRAARRATPRTPQKKAGSKSGRASSGTPARTRNAASGRSSTSPTARKAIAKTA